MIARVGSMLAPFVISLKVSSEIYPPIIFGVIPIIGAVLVLFLPETRGYVRKHNYIFHFLSKSLLFSADMPYQKLSKMAKILGKSQKNEAIKFFF